MNATSSRLSRALPLIAPGTELRDGLDAIDRDRSWTAKVAALRLVHAVPRTAGRELAYAAYRAREGVGLDNYATWCALTDRHGGGFWLNRRDPMRLFADRPYLDEAIDKLFGA